MLYIQYTHQDRFTVIITQGYLIRSGCEVCSLSEADPFKYLSGDVIYVIILKLVSLNICSSMYFILEGLSRAFLIFHALDFFSLNGIFLSLIETQINPILSNHGSYNIYNLMRAWYVEICLTITQEIPIKLISLRLWQLYEQLYKLTSHTLKHMRV